MRARHIIGLILIAPVSLLFYLFMFIELLFYPYVALILGLLCNGYWISFREYLHGIVGWPFTWGGHLMNKNKCPYCHEHCDLLQIEHTNTVDQIDVYIARNKLKMDSYFSGGDVQTINYCPICGRGLNSEKQT